MDGSDRDHEGGVKVWVQRERIVASGVAIVAGAAGGTGTGFWSQAKHFDNALVEKIGWNQSKTKTKKRYPKKRYDPAQDGH